MLVERSLHPDYLSNAYLVADEEGGAALYVDSGAPLEPLLAAAERWGVKPQVVLRTHSHADHVEHERELRLPVKTEAADVGGLQVEALSTPGHSDDMVAFVVNGEAVFTGDTLFKDSVGGGNFAQVRQSVMEVLMKLPPETRVLPGAQDGPRSGASGRRIHSCAFGAGWSLKERNAFGLRASDATLIVWSPDYDGGGKAWVRFDDGRDAIVGGSRVQRG